MLDVLVRQELAEPEDIDRLLELLAVADPKRREEALELVRQLVPLPAVIDLLESARR